MNSSLYAAATLVLPMILAIVFHEVAHGRMALALGDHTAEEQGRLSFNPFAHVSPIGTVLLPGLLALFHLPIFGWAKPVPVDARRLRDPRRAMMLVGAAGPAANFAMALIAAVLLGLMGRVLAAQAMGIGVAGFIVQNLFNFLEINIFLALFNLIPIPPFDGSHIVEGMLPLPLARAYRSLRRLGLAMLIVLLLALPALIPGFSLTQWLVAPAQWLEGLYLALADWVAGHG